MMSLFEKTLWNTRLAVLVAVIAGVGVALGVIFFTTIDVMLLAQSFVAYADFSLTDAARTTLRLSIVSDIVGIVDGYLLAAIMFVFALGLYELFIGNISILEKSEIAPRLLQIHSVDDLKDRLGRVVLLILVVKFFQQALQIKYTTTLDLFLLAMGVVLIGGALYLTSHKGSHHG